MKKLIVILSIFAFIGAGCAKTPAKDTSAIQTQNQNTSDSTSSEDLNTATLKTKEGTEITYKTQPVKNTQNDGDIPITDIILGQAQVKEKMEVGNNFFKPTILRAKPGDAIEISFTKVEGTHTFVIDETNANFDAKQNSKIVFFAPKKAGSYKFYCSVGNHRTNGMEGTLIVK